MHLYAERTPPTVVTHAVSCSFVEGIEHFVVVRGSSLLQLYTSAATRGLRHEAEFPLQGQVTHVSVVKNEQPNGPDRLILVLRVSKVLVLEWDAHNSEFQTLSIHYFEKDLGGPIDTTEFSSKFAADSRLMILLFQHDKFAVIRQPERNLSGIIEQPPPSTVVGTDALDVTNIIDLAFLEGYAEPQLAVLYQEQRTWPGLEQRTGGGTAVAVYSMFPTPIRVSSTKFGWDANKIVSLKDGGYVVYGLGDRLVRVDSMGYQSEIICSRPLDEAQATVLQNSDLILSLRDGSLFRATCGPDWTIESLSLSGPRDPTCVTASLTKLLIGSATSDTRVFSVTLSDSPHESTEVGDKLNESLGELFSGLTQIKHSQPASFDITESLSLKSLGSITSVCTMPNSFATSAGRVVSSISRSLDLRPYYTVHPSLESITGVWIVGGFLVVSSATKTLMFPGPKYSRLQNVAGVSTDQPTLALAKYGSNDAILFVQPRSITIHSRAWRLQKTLRLERDAVYAEIHGDLILVLSESALDVYRAPKLTPLAIPSDVNGDLVALDPTKIAVSLGGASILLHWFSGQTQRYDVTDLPRVLSPHNTSESDESEIEIRAIYLFDDVVGLWFDDLIVLYQIMDSGCLLKAYTVPCSIHVEPAVIRINNRWGLLLRGRKSFVVIRDETTPYRCVPVKHAGGRIVDISCTNTGLAYTDETGRVNLADIPNDIDVTTVGLPLLRHEVPEDIRSVAYHRKLDLLLVGCDHELHVLQMPGFRHIQSVALPETERLVTVKALELGDMTGRELVVVGTTEHITPISEDGQENHVSEDAVQTNGWVRVYQPSTVGAERAKAKVRLREVHSEHLRGTVSGIAESMGRLVVGHSQQIHVYMLTTQLRLEVVAFFDAQVYVESLKSVRNLVALGDAVCGLTLINYMLEPQRLEALSKDSHSPTTTDTKVNALEFVSSGSRGDLYLAVSDVTGRLKLVRFDPELPATKGGWLLLQRGSIFIGRQVNSMTLYEHPKHDDLISVGGTADGALVSVSPLEEHTYRALFVVTQQMMDKEQLPGCLNPRMHRAFLGPDVGQVIDLMYAQMFWSLPLDRQYLYSRRLGLYGLEEIRRALRSVMQL